MKCLAIDWGAVGVVATALATFVALALGIRDALRRKRDAVERGRIALAMQLPEIARLVKLFDLVEDLYKLIKMPDADLRSHVLQLERLAPAFQTSLTNASVADFVGMPKHLSYNLPTVIHSLHIVGLYARQMKARSIGAYPASPAMRVFLSHVEEAQSFTVNCGTDFRAALTYALKHIVSEQMKNMADFMPERAESNAP